MPQGPNDPFCTACDDLGVIDLDRACSCPAGLNLVVPPKAPTTPLPEGAK